MINPVQRSPIENINPRTLEKGEDEERRASRKPSSKSREVIFAIFSALPVSEPTQGRWIGKIFPTISSQMRSLVSGFSNNGFPSSVNAWDFERSVASQWMVARTLPSLVPMELHASNEGGDSAVEGYIQDSRGFIHFPRSWSTNTLSSSKNLRTLGIATLYAASADVTLGADPSRDKARYSIT